MSINEKVRKFTEKITQNITYPEESDLAGEQRYKKDSEVFDNVQNDINGGRMPQIVIETDESEDDHDTKYVKLSAEEQFRYTFSGPIKTDEGDEELHEIEKHKENEIGTVRPTKNNQNQYIPKNTVETGESEHEVDYKKVKRNVTVNNSKPFPTSVIETDSDDSNGVNYYDPSYRSDRNNAQAYAVVDRGSNEVEDEEVDEVDGNVFEAHHVKAAKQTINCLMCSRYISS